MRLRTKYAIVLLGILLVLGTVVLGSAELFKQQTIEQERTTLDNTTSAFANQLDQTLSDRRDFIRRYTATEEIQNFSQTEATLSRMVETSEFFSVQLIDENGRVHDWQGEINETEREAEIGQDVTDLEYVQLGLNGKRQVTVFDRIGEDDFLILVSVPVVNANGEVNGVLVGATFLSNMNVFSAIRPLETSTQTVRVQGSINDSEVVTLRESENHFNDTITSSAQVDAGTGWVVEVERDRSALTSQLQFLQFIQFGSLFVVLLSVFGLGYYQYRTTLQQTDQLLGGFDELTEGNFEHNLNLTAAEEWNQIGNGFNTMADGLQEREEAIKQRERQIRERERRLSVLNRVLRHNLQNDMTVIQGYAEILPSADDAQLEQASEKILEKSRGLVNHGKKARRLETVMENAEDGPTDLDIAQNVRDILGEHEREYPEFTVESDIPDQAWVSAISGLEFGIESIIENAFEHNDSDDPMVSVSMEREEAADEIFIRVCDNGPGVPEHEREVLTQDEETSLEHGSGIGLWLAYWAVVKSDGELEFDDADDGGAAITIRLPACEPPADADERGGVLNI